MRLKTILKELDKVLETLRSVETKEDYARAIKKLLQLRARIEEKIKREEAGKSAGKKLQHLMGWYLNLWEGKPPEYLKFSNPNAIIGKHLKELITIYERNGEDVETLKRDYEHFKNTWKKGNRGILHFRSALPTIKQTHSSSWTSPENERGMDYYIRQLEELDDDGGKEP